MATVQMEEWLSPFYKTTQDFKRWSQVTVMSKKKTISPLVGVGRHSAHDLGFHYGDSLVLLISPALTLDHYHHPSYFNSPYYFSFWASCPRTLVCPLSVLPALLLLAPLKGGSFTWRSAQLECDLWEPFQHSPAAPQHLLHLSLSEFFSTFQNL